MSASRRTVTTIETHEVLIIRRPMPETPLLPCAACAEAGRLLTTPQEAARRAGVSQRTIYRWVEDGLVHFTETADGLLFVCLAPLTI